MKNANIRDFQKTQEMPFSAVFGSGGSQGMGFELLNKTKHLSWVFKGIRDIGLRPLCLETTKKG